MPSRKKRLCDGPLRPTPYVDRRLCQPDGRPHDDDVRVLVAATHEEMHNIWLLHWAINGTGYYGPDHLQSWEQHGIGLTETVGKIGGLPVNVSMFFARINGLWVGFWYICSRAADYQMAKEWLEKTFKNVKPRASTDATNFMNGIRGATEP